MNRRLYKAKDNNPHPFGSNIKYIVVLKINHGCNFNCAECFYGDRGEKSRVEKARIRTPSPEELAGALGFLAPSIIYITGGEPLLYKNFPECCAALSRNHLVGILSNLSMPAVLQHTIHSVGARNLFAVGGSLHIPELKRLDKWPAFVNSIGLLKQYNVPTFVIYNVGRKLEPQFNYFIAKIKQLGVPIFAKYKQGTGPINKSVYKTVESAGVNMSWLKPRDIGRAALPSMKCGAGVVSLNIDGLDGTIKKCIYDPDDMGNIFTGEFNPAVNSFCAEHCYCHPYLFSPGFSDRYDNWAEFSKLVKPNTAKAHVD